MLSFFEIQIQYFHMGNKNPFSMTKSAFKDISIFGVLKWVTVHSQTEKYVEIVFTPLDWKMKHARILKNSIREVEGESPLPTRKWKILVKIEWWKSRQE